MNTQLENHVPDRASSMKEARGVGPVEDVGDLYCSEEINILILDDDEAICRLIEASLLPYGFKLASVSDPTQIHAILQERAYHLIIFDYYLPPLESTQILEWFREHQPDASVIVVTAFPSVDNALHCLRARTYDYIVKPFQITSLQQAVLGCLETKGLLRMSEAALKESLGRTIRERRKQLGLTLAQMAQRTGVSLGYLSQIELGKNSASIETLYRISLGLGVKMSELFEDLQCMR